MNIEEVKDFIRTANRDELNDIRKIFNRAVTLITKDEVIQFTKGDRVTINHRSKDPNEVFIVERVNKKTISISKESSYSIQKFKVSPNLLVSIPKI